jgi:nucleoside-diphosphate-sugar epimerase
MKIFVIGASGFLGGGAARALAAAGHEVLAAARSEAARERLTALGYRTVDADVERPHSLAEPARSCDAAIYAVQLQHADAEAIETRALEAIVDALAGTSKPFTYTSGVWYYGSTGERVAGEDFPANPPAGLTGRPRIEALVRDAAGRGVRSTVLRPGIVYGHGGGLPALLVQSASGGVAKTIGDGLNHWPVVHVDDLARLYVLALTQAAGGDAYNATDDTSFTQRDIAAAASRAAGGDGATVSWPVEEAVAAMGGWIANLALDQRVTSARAHTQLGWSPQEATIIEDLERGSYATHPS